ncbi:hypothetical protein [Dyella sp.]|uniref:hypothetical protein n=1 Tax=Dyella sp. TaxID=1869338 RepID=UPI002ED599EE
MKKSNIRPALLAGLFATLLAGPAMAQQQSSAGLGNSWPSDTQDVSSNPNYHAYVWVKSGVKYIQINDASGHVLAAVASSNGQFLVLPMGLDSQYVQTAPAGSSTPTPPSNSVSVYHDDTVNVTASPQSNGSTAVMASSICNDPVECSTHLNGH